MDENVIKNYLLGSLPEAERDQFEETLVCDPKVLEMLEVVECELIDDYESQSLKPEERKQFETYFLAAPARQEQFNIQRALITAIKPISPKPWPLNTKLMVFAASTVAVIIVGYGIWKVIQPRSDVSEGMVALNRAYRAELPLEGRVSGVDYSRYPEATRGGPSSNVDVDSLNRAIVDFNSGLAKEPGPARHGLGRAYLTKGEFDKAISELQSALGFETSNGQILSDLGLAYIEKGKHEADPLAAAQDFAKSRDYLDRAIAANSNLPDPFFNRALLFEALKQTDNAQKDWQTYIAKDPNSEWTKIAKRHLKP